MSSAMKFPGLASYVAQINQLAHNSLEICQKASAKGAAVVADACKAEIEGLATQGEAFALGAYQKHKKDNGTHKAMLSPRQKKGLQESMGLAPMQNDHGFINTKLGFDGYNEITTKTYPKGQPNALIARSLESGSSAFDKDPFVRRATNASKAKAEKAIETALDNEIKKIVK